MLEKHGLEVHQATISRDIQELGYELVLEGLFKSISPRVRQFSIKHAYMITINCEPGTEGAVAGLIYNLWGANIRGVFPGLGCVLILTNNQKNARVIEKPLRRYSQGHSNYITLDQEHEDPVEPVPLTLSRLSASLGQTIPIPWLPLPPGLRFCCS